MRRWHVTMAVVVAVLGSGLAVTMTAQQKAESRDMTLLGSNDLQARSAYQPIIQKQGDRYIAYIGHHAGTMPNLLNGRMEDNGTSVVDVTNPRQPRYVAHIPGAGEAPGQGQAQMVRTCSGADLPKADKSKFYLLRSLGTTGHEVWDVTTPEKPSRLTLIVNEQNAAARALYASLGFTPSPVSAISRMTRSVPAGTTRTARTFASRGRLSR